MSAPRDRLPLPALVGVTIGAAIMVAPLLWTLLLSIKANSELMRDSASALAPPWTLANYAAILRCSSSFLWLL
jgi:multiple sugar transport system permease protein